MSDLTREEVIDTLEMLRNPEPWEPKLSKRAEEALDMAISVLSENTGEWIPVSEENLPEDFQKVLVTVVRYNGTRVVREAEYHCKTFRVLANNEMWEVGEEGLIAWMPKPEPYQKGGK